MTTGHIFVVASGFGKRVIPKASPFTFRLEGNHTLVVSTGAHIAIIEPDHTVTDAGANAVDVADVTRGQDWPMWWLETSPYLVPLPVGWTAHASGAADPSVFDLVGPNDIMIYVQVRDASPLGIPIPAVTFSFRTRAWRWTYTRPAMPDGCDLSRSPDSRV